MKKSEADKWAEALAGREEDEPRPPGWFTVRELAEQIGLSPGHVGKMIAKATATGQAERRTFRRVNSQGRRPYPTPHYKLNNAPPH